ncbi:acyl-CoA dehydrogenase family protein [Rhodobaculum claviforme]|uniref:Acyl-CoA dehydrogenase n=1 Tax=Rhodobaculum claviforme TaxID=1549854 RepID=A0A934WJX4_9RHOB|nr:acyl-CoA dehydrogenase family protein [Rhodobaculum claviforme]MBK5928382.1 acyl-CoA dehydrogenase [Rhodobaculum claviforme]
MTYRAPLADFHCLLTHVVDFAAVAATERFAEATPDTVGDILGGAARLSEEVLAPLQRVGDLHPARLEGGRVHTPPGFDAAWRAVADGGWLGLSARPESGGMGLPVTLAVCVQEMMAGACLSFQLGPLLTQGQIEALEHHADPALRALVLPRLVSGDWLGTMNLTEPQAGSDVGALRTRAEAVGDGTYRLTGQKIWISWGDNDFTANVSHLVLARLPDAPPGPRGISLFLVPRDHPDTGAPNGVQVVGLEEKMGLHGSPTATMAYDGAVGWMVGAPGGGLRAMFTMMNNARLGVGVQGIGQAEAALQLAGRHAADRVQGATGPGRSASILGHADVRRMLAVMRAEVFAARGIALATAVAIDRATATGCAAQTARAGWLTPIAKAFGTDTGVDVAGIAMQVQGGAAYVEATGAAQYLRDVRVTTIYEGTNGIQAMDLVGRKLADGGAAARAMLEALRSETLRSETGGTDALSTAQAAAVERLAHATEAMIATDADARGGGAAAFLRGWARVLGGHVHLRAARAEGGARAALARVYMQRCLPEAFSALAEAEAGEDDLFALDDAALSGVAGAPLAGAA